MDTVAPRNRTGLVEVVAEALYVQAADACYIAFIHLKEDSKAHWRQVANESLTALENAGCVVVPREATDGMCEAAWEAPAARQDADNKRERNRYRCEPIYTTMISASPYVKEG